MERKFIRKSNDKIFGGVCSGLAEYVDVDKSLVRILTLIGIIVSGVLPGLFLYILCVIIVPKDTEAHGGFSEENSNKTKYTEENNYSPERNYDEPRDTGNSRLLFGGVLIAAGIFFFARMFIVVDLRYVFAGLLILGGLFMLLGNRKR